MDILLDETNNKRKKRYKKKTNCAAVCMTQKMIIFSNEEIQAKANRNQTADGEIVRDASIGSIQVLDPMKLW